jgi:hypothetical protein
VLGADERVRAPADEIGAANKRADATLEKAGASIARVGVAEKNEAWSNRTGSATGDLVRASHERDHASSVRELAAEEITSWTL